jgi:UDPglucose 6-dehydrogenase
MDQGPGTLAVVGCGRLGLTMALAFATKGFTVHGVDISPSLVAGIADRTFSSDEPGVNEAMRAIPADDPRLQATTDLAAAAAVADTVLICVDTPSTGGERHYDHSKVGAVLSALNSHAARQQAAGGEAGSGSASGIPRHVVVCCTVMPGYLIEVGAHLLRDSPQLRAGLLYNPLFIAQGEIMRGLLRPDLILIGEAGDRVGESSGGNALTQIWARVCELGDESGERSGSGSGSGGGGGRDLPIRRMSWTSAEITKLSLNCFVTMKIAFAVGAVLALSAQCPRFLSSSTLLLKLNPFPTLPSHFSFVLHVLTLPWCYPWPVCGCVCPLATEYGW